jgi:C4-type Zn-finger protein
MLNCPNCRDNKLFNLYSPVSIMLEQIIWIDDISVRYYVCTICGYIDVDNEYREYVEKFEREFKR